MKKIATLTLGVALIALTSGCSRTDTTTTTTTTNTNANRVTNANTNTVATTTTTTTNRNYNANMTREEFDRDRAGYEADARNTGRRIGTGANDAWIHFKTKTALATTNDLRDSTVNVDVDNGNVTLNGTVETVAQKNAAAKVVAGIDGARLTSNNLRVAPNDSMMNTNGNANGNMNRNRP